MAVQTRASRTSGSQAARTARQAFASPIERSLLAGTAVFAAFFVSQQASPVIREGIAVSSFLLHLLRGEVMF